MNAQLLKTILRRYLAGAVLTSLMLGAAGCTVPDSQLIANANQFQTQLAPAEMKDQELSNYLHATGAWTGSDAQLQAKAPGIVHLIAGSPEYQLV